MSLRIPPRLGYDCLCSDPERTTDRLPVRTHLRPGRQPLGLGEDCAFYERTETPDLERERWRRYDLLDFVPLQNVATIPICGEA